MTTRERVLDRTMALFLQKGCKSITMDEVSAHNGISKRTLYEMFTDKSNLLEECIAHDGEKRKQIANRIKTESSNILEFILSFQDYESKKSEMTSRLFIEEMKKFYPNVYEKLMKRAKESQIEYIESLIEDGIKDGLFVKGFGHIAVKARILTLLVEISAYAECEDLKKVSGRSEIFMSSVAVFLKGLSTPKGREVIDAYFEKKGYNKQQ